MIKRGESPPSTAYSVLSPHPSVLVGGAAMAFVVTPQGKAMPLSLATVETREGVRYCLPHFIDCPHAKEWSKR